MIRRTVKIQLLVFAILGALFMTYAGARYVGLNTLVNKPYTVVAYFDDSGGIFTNASVTERGVTVGKVGALKLTKQGVAVDLIIDNGTKIAQDSDARVANLSFAGEQYVDIAPQTDSGPWMGDGSIIPASRTSIPISDAQFLLGLDQLSKSVPTKDLQIVVRELGKATDGLGPTLTKLIAQGNDLTAAVTANLPQQLDLINKSATVLDTANATYQQFQASSKNLADLVQQLRDSDADLAGRLNASTGQRTGGLFANGTAAAKALNNILNDNKSNLPVLLGNLITVGQIQNLRLPALRSLLTIYPEDIRNGFYNAPGDGTSHFGGVNNSNDPVCENGYGATTRRSGEATPTDVPAATNVSCQLPVDSTTDIRGSRNAPRPPGDLTDPALTAGGTAHGSVSNASTSAAPSNDLSSIIGTAATYDPTTSQVTVSDGRTYLLNPMNGMAALEPGGGFTALLVDPVTGF